MSVNTPARFQNASYDDVPKGIRDQLRIMRETKQGIYIEGAVGTGKTHMAYAIQKKWNEAIAKMERTTEPRMIMWNVPELFALTKRDISKPENEKINAIQKLTETGAPIILDDFGAERTTEFVLDEIYLLINKRYNEMQPIIFTSNHPLEEIQEKMGERIASRIAGMTQQPFVMTGPDKRLKN